jgi:hypothetical protein
MFPDHPNVESIKLISEENLSMQCIMPFSDHLVRAVPAARARGRFHPSCILPPPIPCSLRRAGHRLQRPGRCQGGVRVWLRVREPRGDRGGLDGCAVKGMRLVCRDRGCLNAETDAADGRGHVRVERACSPCCGRGEHAREALRSTGEHVLRTLE